MQIRSLDIVTCRLAMERPVIMAGVEARARDVVCLRLHTDGGVYGDAIGYTRGTALAAELKALEPAVIGRDALMRRALMASLAGSNVPGRSVFARAHSLLDIALWDVAAKVADMPLYKLVGGYRSRIPVMVTGGYYAYARSLEDIEEEVRGYVAAGFPQVKLLLDGTRPAWDRELVGRAIDAAGDGVRIAVDAHWAWADLDSALETCRALDDLGLAFLEDPFPPQQWRLTAELARLLRTPLAAGEDVVDANAYRDLLESVLVLRVDATTSGGLTGAITGCELARLVGRTVIPHVWTAIHGQLAGIGPAVSFVETILPEVGADPIERLLARLPVIEAGELVLDESPGGGLELDWGAVVRLAV